MKTKNKRATMNQEHIDQTGNGNHLQPPEPDIRLPEPPEGMKWVYRGKGAEFNGDCCFYNEESILPVMTGYGACGFSGLHYWQAVPLAEPELTHIKYNGRLTELDIPVWEEPPSLDPKGDAGKRKPQLHLLPKVFLESTAEVLKLGSEKYGAYNFRDAQVCATTYISAIMRHTAAWSSGENIDPESGQSHIAHIAANAAILLDTEAHGTLADDRWKPKGGEA